MREWLNAADREEFEAVYDLVAEHVLDRAESSQDASVALVDLEKVRSWSREGVERIHRLRMEAPGSTNDAEEG